MSPQSEPSMWDEAAQLIWDALAILGIVTTIMFTIGYAWGYFGA